MSVAAGVAAALTRAWARLYTKGTPADLGEIRRAEIDSDVWEHANDAQENGVPQFVFATQLLGRTLRGIPDDLSWRVEAIHARRATTTGREIPMLGLSVREMRWMGISGMLAGILWAGNALTMPAKPNALLGYAHIPLSLLFIVGLYGFYAQQRERAGKVARAGFILLFTSFLAWSALNVLGGGLGVRDDTLLMNILGVTFALLLAPGFLLLGIGLQGSVRRVPLALGLVFLARLLLSPVMLRYFPSTAGFFSQRGDSPAGITVFFLMGIGLAMMGYSVFRAAAAAPSSRR